MNTQNPTFPEMKMNMGALASNDETLPIRISIFSGNNQLGFVNTTVADLKKGNTLNLNAQQGGQIAIKSFTVVERPSFVEYLRAGW